MKAFLMTLIAAYSITCSAADQPNFSGRWKMNSARSNFGPVPAPDSVIRNITHVGPTITIVEEQTASGTAWTSSRTVNTDGQPVTFAINGSSVTTAIYWEADNLIADTTIDAELKFHDRMSLSEDAETLTSKALVTSYQGEVELIVVFDRQ
jgi:hypothetical protein